MEGFLELWRRYVRSLECWLQSTPPVSAPNVSKAKGLCLADLRHLLAADPHALPEGREEDGGEELMVREPLVFWLI